MDPHSRAQKKNTSQNTSHGNEVLPQDTTHLIQRSCYQRGSPCQDPTGKQAIAPHEDFLTIVKKRKLQWYGHVSRSSGLAKIILQDIVKGGRRQGRQRKRLKTTSGNGQARSSPIPRGQWRLGKTEGSGCGIFCGVPTTLAVKGLIMMMMVLQWCMIATRIERVKHSVTALALCD